MANEAHRNIMISYVHRRVLIIKKDSYAYSRSRSGEVMEVKILEVSPSRNFTKIQDPDGRKYWLDTDGITIIEPLNNSQEEKPKS